MDTPRSALRDRSNDDEFATTSLVRGLVDQAESANKPSHSAPQGGRDPEAAVGADDPARCAAGLPIVTPEPRQPAAGDASSAASAGASQQRDVEATQAGDTRARRESTAAARIRNRRHAVSRGTRHSSSSSISSNPAAARTRPPPPVACTLVAFEPGSLGLELEAIVDEEARVAQRGEKHRDQRRGSDSSSRHRRLGCRVFRVTPGGQAARHGSVHPGDALVVLDGIDVLSDNFEDITRVLLERQGRRRLIGFMGAAAVGASAAAAAAAAAAATTVATASSAPRKHRLTPSSSSLSSLTASEATTAMEQPAPGGTASAPRSPVVVPNPPNPSAPRRENSRHSAGGSPAVPDAPPDAAAASAAASAACRRRSPERRNNERGRRRQRIEDTRGGGDAAASCQSGNESARGGGWSSGEKTRDGPDRTVFEVAPGGKEIGSSATAVAAAAASGPPRRGRSSSFGSMPSGSRPSPLELERPATEHLPHPRDTTTRPPPPAAAAAGGTSRTVSTPAGRAGEADSGSRAPADSDRRRFDGSHPFGQPGQRTSSAQAASGAGVGVENGGSGSARRFAIESLGSSWGSAATTGRRSTAGFAAGGRQTRPLDGSRGESLQRSLTEALEDKSALAAERAWLLEELQRARETTLERDGALAGHEVKADVLRMEIGALEGELRRARQELGASEAGRRELHEATKRDLARRDHEAADLAAALRRERAARDRDADESAAATARAVDAAAAAARNAAEDARRRADAADARAAEADERVAVAAEAEAARAAAAAESAEEVLRRERERREMEVREREEEISALLLRVSASEGRSRRIAEDKDEQLREVEKAAVKSMEAAERRRTEWEEKASALSARLRERDAEGARKDRLVKDLEARLGRARAEASEAQEKEAAELRRVAGELEMMRKAVSDREARGRREVERLSRRLRDEEGKAAAAAAKLKTLEQRTRFLETGAAAARQRAEAGARVGKEVSDRLAEAETERACQEVAVATLKAQLEELRRGAAAGVAALREAAKLKKLLEGALAPQQPTPASTQSPDTATDTDTVPATVTAAGGKNGRRVPGEGAGTGHRAGTLSLVELAETLLRREDGVGRELETVRAALTTARSENKALRARERDAAELRSLLEQKRGVSAQLAKGAEAARARAECAERAAEEMRAEAMSLRSKAGALEARVSEAEEAEAGAKADLSAASGSVASLEKALSAAQAEKAEAVRRLTRQGGDHVALQSRLEGTLAELEAVKVALYQGSDQRASSQRKACVGLSEALSRGRARPAAEALAFLRWRQATTTTTGATTTSAGGPLLPEQGALPVYSHGNGSGSGVDSGGMPEEGVTSDALLREEVVAAKTAATAARAETDALARRHADAVEESRLARSELACVHLRTRMCGARVLSGVLHKWSARQSARAFWRLRTADTAAAMRRVAPLCCARCGPTGSHEATGGSSDSGLTSLTIHAPTPTLQGAGSAWASPPGSDTSGGESVRRRPRSASRNRQHRDRGSGGGGGGAAFIRLGGVSPDGAGNSALDTDGGGSGGGGRGRQAHRRERGRSRGRDAGGKSSPPPSPASSRARNKSSPPAGSFRVAWSGGGGVATPGSTGVDGCDTERSFFSTASSEPRYHCLRPELSSPAWSHAGSADGSALPPDAFEVFSGEQGGASASARGERCEPTVFSSGDGGGGGQDDTGSGDGRDGGGFSASGMGMYGKGDGCSGLGLEVSVGGDGGGDSWWALSDDELDV
eukprot:g11571.t1